MINDAFSKCHPAVNFLFFAAAMVFTVVILHPAYLLAGGACAAVYYLLLRGKKALKAMLWLLPLFLILTAINPLFNLRGSHILFTIFGRPYTWEALLHGAAIAGILVNMMLWFGCYNAVMTGDKFSSLFGNLIPALSLLLVMIFRMVPSLIEKIRQIAGTRTCIGKGLSEQASIREKISGGMTVLSVLTGWALEGSIITADSMRSRGYGTAKRTSFQIYRMSGTDIVIAAITALLAAGVATSAATGSIAATYTPVYTAAPLSGRYIIGFICYCIFCLIPSVLHLWEALLWHISKSKI